jgi:hypothetical protein
LLKEIRKKENKCVRILSEALCACAA